VWGTRWHQAGHPPHEARKQKRGPASNYRSAKIDASPFVFGTRLFDSPDHDTRVLRAEAGPIPVAGFFAQGELGPVGGQNSMHGFTASVVLFED
jgi:small ligand-binding sensory domain FIST